MKGIVGRLIAGLLLLSSLQLMGGSLSYGIRETLPQPQMVEFRPVDGKGDVVLKDIGKSTIIFGPESFESETFPPTGWSQYSLYPYSSYHWYRKENNGHDGSYVAWIDCDPNAYYNGQEELLQTPQLDFSQCA